MYFFDESLPLIFSLTLIQLRYHGDISMGLYTTCSFFFFLVSDVIDEDTEF